MARITTACANFFRLLGILVGLMFYELLFFIGLLSLSIGVTTGLKLALKLVLDVDLNIVLETFFSWQILACTVSIYLGIYRRCLFPRVRQEIKTHRNVLQAIPRIIYFILFTVAVYGICYEYEAVHNYRPLVARSAVYVQKNETDAFRHYHLRKVLRMPVYTKEDFAPEAPNEKLHTALFLMMMSYIIYCSGQILGIFMIRIMREIPMSPMIPQVYAVASMMFVQVMMTVFYAFPLLMTLVACHIFQVDGASTYMFTLCLALTIAMAAAQLESATPFPTMSRLGPYYYFEGQHRARINLIFFALPAIAYFFFKGDKSYPLSAGDLNFVHFTFWVAITLLHTVKTLYLTTWRALRPVQMPPGGIGERQLFPPDYEMLPLPNAHPQEPHPPSELLQAPLISDNNLATVRVIDNGNEEDLEGSGQVTPEKSEAGVRINPDRKKTIPIHARLGNPDDPIPSSSALVVSNPSTSTEDNARGSVAQSQTDTNKNSLTKEVLKCFEQVRPQENAVLEQKIGLKDTVDNVANGSETDISQFLNSQNAKNDIKSEDA